MNQLVVRDPGASPHDLETPSTKSVIANLSPLS